MKETSILYISPEHIRKIEQNGGLKGLQKRWEQSLGNKMIAEKKEDGTILVTPKGRKRFYAKIR
jgi:hypothetical protein